MNHLHVTDARIVEDAGRRHAKVLELTLPTGQRISGGTVEELEREFVRGKFMLGEVR